MRHLRPLAFIIIISSLLYGCPEDHSCPSCNKVDLNLHYKSDSLFLDSIVYLEKNLSMPLIYYHYPDSVGGELKLNELDTVSTFVFYHSSEIPDTVSFKYRFEKEYGHKCEEYFLDIKKFEVKKSTFSDFELLTPDNLYSCFGLKISY